MKAAVYRNERGIKSPNLHTSPWPLLWSFKCLGKMYVDSTRTVNWRIACSRSLWFLLANMAPGVSVLRKLTFDIGAEMINGRTNSEQMWKYTGRRRKQKLSPVKGLRMEMGWVQKGGMQEPQNCHHLPTICPLWAPRMCGLLLDGPLTVLPNIVALMHQTLGLILLRLWLWLETPGWFYMSLSNPSPKVTITDTIYQLFSL